MKLKSLLLGSAAALVAFSGARAADAVIAEPEPVEYVRVCDAFGAGYFYLPGTETCLKIGGFVRYQIDLTSADSFDDEGASITDTWKKTTQANISLTAKSETEMGTLTGFVELTTDYTTDALLTDSTDKTVFLDAAYIELGGLKMGHFDNAFDGDIVSEVDSLGGSKTNSMQYTFASGGFDASVSLDHVDADDDYVPNVAANAGFSAGAVAVRAFVAYDQFNSEWAAKIRAGADVTEGGRLEVAAIYASDSNYVWSEAEWSIAAAYKQKVSDTITVAAGVQYWSDVAFASGVSQWKVGGNVDWTPVTNFLVRAQVDYTDNSAAADGVVTGRLRFQRSF